MNVETLKKFDYSYWKGHRGSNLFRISESWTFCMSRTISALSIYRHYFLSKPQNRPNYLCKTPKHYHILNTNHTENLRNLLHTRCKMYTRKSRLLKSCTIIPGDKLMLILTFSFKWKRKGKFLNLNVISTLKCCLSWIVIFVWKTIISSWTNWRF